MMNLYIIERWNYRDLYDRYSEGAHPLDAIVIESVKELTNADLTSEFLSNVYPNYINEDDDSPYEPMYAYNLRQPALPYISYV